MGKDKQIRVLMVLDYLNISGTKTHVLSLAKYFMARGIHVAVTGIKGPFSRVLEEAGCPVHHINFYGNAVKIKTKLEKVINIEKINIIHAHSPIGGEYAAEISKSLDIPLVGTFHGTYYNKKNMLKINNASKAIISVSPAVKDYWAKLGVKSEYIPLTIDLKEFSFKPKSNIRAQFGIPKQSPIILYVARQEGAKAHIGLHVMEACHLLRQSYGMKNLQCIIAGDGEDINEVRNKGEEYNRLNGEAFIHVIGKFYEMPDLYSASSIVVGTGLSALEAMACEKPLIAAGIQGFFGTVNEENVNKAWNNGFGDHQYDKLQEFDTALFVDSLKEILLFPNKMKLLGKMGRRNAEANFDISINNKIIDMYQSLINF